MNRALVVIEPALTVADATAAREESGATDDETVEVDLWGYNIDPLKKAIETQRYQMDVVDTLLACLHASFEAEIDYAMHRLQPPDPAFVIVAARKMLRDCIRGLDSSVLGPLIRASRDTSTQPHP